MSQTRKVRKKYKKKVSVQSVKSKVGQESQEKVCKNKSIGQESQEKVG